MVGTGPGLSGMRIRTRRARDGAAGRAKRASSIQDSPGCGSEPGGLGVAAGAGADGLLDELDESRAVDELDRVLGDELLGGEREGPRGDEEALVAPGVVDRAEGLLEVGRS